MTNGRSVVEQAPDRIRTRRLVEHLAMSSGANWTLNPIAQKRGDRPAFA
jgi:hypothetical protein